MLSSLLPYSCHLCFQVLQKSVALSLTHTVMPIFTHTGSVPARTYSQTGLLEARARHGPFFGQGCPHQVEALTKIAGSANLQGLPSHSCRNGKGLENLQATQQSTRQPMSTMNFTNLVHCVGELGVGSRTLCAYS